MTNNGGCSHDCIDRGDGLGQCVCPCGYELDSSGKTCIQTPVCPFDVTFWLDGSENTCNNADFQTKQKTHIADLVDFFRREVRSYDARISTGFYSDGKVATKLSEFDSNDVDQIIDDINNYNEPCGKASIKNAFDQFPNDREKEAATVAFVSMGGELTDSDSQLLAKRPQNIDNLIVIAQNTTTTLQYLTQTGLIGCGEFETNCPSVVMIDDGIDAAAIESRVSRTSCYDREFSSSISCSEFHMEIEIPSCALRGLSMDDIVFNSGADGDCGLIKVDNGTYYSWKINYNDCGTVRTVDDSGVISYTNSLKTLLNEDGAVYPILPIFDVPLQCDLHTRYEFVFHGDYYPKLANFQADVEVEGIMTGNLGIFADANFTTSFGNKTVETGIPVYVQSVVESPGSPMVQLLSCITSADELSNMTTVNGGVVWPLIDDGCLVDWTVNVLPRGPNEEVRFEFETFQFKDSVDGNAVNIQCQYKQCIGEKSCDPVKPCTNGASARRRRSLVTPMASRQSLNILQN